MRWPILNDSIFLTIINLTSTRPQVRNNESTMFVKPCLVDCSLHFSSTKCLVFLYVNRYSCRLYSTLNKMYEKSKDNILCVFTTDAWVWKEKLKNVLTEIHIIRTIVRIFEFFIVHCSHSSFTLIKRNKMYDQLCGCGSI